MTNATWPTGMADPVWNRRRSLQALSLAALPWGLGACGNKRVPALRVSLQSWPGYEFLHLARQNGLWPADTVHLIDAPNASSSIRLLGTKGCEAACLTLDEVLTARERGIQLTVVAVLDVSNGADVLLARPQVKGLADLKGRTIGVEQTATGAVMLDAALQSAKLNVSEVKLLPVPFDQHEMAFASGKIDALVTFEPVKSKLIATGAQALFSSAQVPGRILDVIAVLSSMLEPYSEALKGLVAGHFKARQNWVDDPAAHVQALAQRMQLAPADVPGAYAELELPDLVTNRRLLTGNDAPLLATAKQLGAVMVRGGLLAGEPDLSFLIDSRFVS